MGKSSKLPQTELEEEAAAAHAQAEAQRLHMMNSFQWLAYQTELAVERGMDLVLGPATQDSLRPGGTLRENHLLQQQEAALKRRKKKGGSTSSSRGGRSDGGAPRRTKSGRLIPTDFERQAAAKRRAMQILELQREDEEWRAQVKATAAANAQDVLRTTLTQVGGLYAVSQACLLSIFVPQRCPAIIACLADGSNADTCTTSKWFTYPVDVPPAHLCSLKENVDWWTLSQRNKNVLIINAVTLLLMLIGQAYFWKRETWMINNLEEDNGVPYDSLPAEIEAAGDTEVAEAVHGYNLGAFIMASLIMTFIVINFGVSTDFLINGDQLYNYNLGTRTIVGLLTNTMLVSTKVIGYLSYARLSYANAWAISMFTVVPLSYNRLDDTRKVRTKTIADVPIEFEDLDLEEATSRR